MTLQEFAKENPDLWQCIAKGRKFRFWDDKKENCIDAKLNGIIFPSYDTEFNFHKEGGAWYKNCEPINTVKKPASFAEAIKFFEESEDYSFSQRSGIYGYRYINNNGKSEFASIGWIREVCTGRKPLPEWFPCEEVEE